MGTSQDASELYHEFLERNLRGDQMDFRALCAAHPELAAQLEQLRADYDGLMARLQRRSSESRQRESGGEPHRGDTSELGLRGAQPRYDVKEQIARGGMGTILLAWDTELRRKVAMKVA